MIKYLTALPAVQVAVGAALLVLGDGNWKMGEGLQLSKGPKLMEGQENVILEHYVCKSDPVRLLYMRNLKPFAPRLSGGKNRLLSFQTISSLRRYPP